MQRGGRNSFAFIKSAVGPTIALVIVAYFAGSAVFGANGLLSLAGYRAERTDRIEKLKALDVQRATLIRHAALLDPQHVDPDYADELVRRQTGQIRPDEVILPSE